jgi:hypothetical protein
VANFGSESPHAQVLAVLVEYLQRTIKSPRFKTAQAGWPDASKELVLPAMSAVIRSEQLTQYDPYLKKTENLQTDSEKPSSDNTYDCGEWEFSIQLDLWLKTNAERYDAQTAITNAFHKFEERVSPAIKLQLKEYFGTEAIYSFVKSSIPDAAYTPLTQEFRVMVDISCTCSHLVRRENESVITATELVADFEET